MANKEDDFWQVPPLSAEDQRLLNAYVLVGQPVDQLPYTDNFDKLMQLLDLPDKQEQRYHVFQRLLYLRKTGRLPRVGYSPAEVY